MNINLMLNIVNLQKSFFIGQNKEQYSAFSRIWLFTYDRQTSEISIWVVQNITVRNSYFKLSKTLLNQIVL